MSPVPLLKSGATTYLWKDEREDFEGQPQAQEVVLKRKQIHLITGSLNSDKEFPTRCPNVYFPLPKVVIEHVFNLSGSWYCLLKPLGGKLAYLPAPYFSLAALFLLAGTTPVIPTFFHVKTENGQSHLQLRPLSPKTVPSRSDLTKPLPPRHIMRHIHNQFTKWHLF